MLLNPNICEKCDAAFKGDVCLNCGNVVGVEELSSDDPKIKPEVHGAKVTSIFLDLADENSSFLAKVKATKSLFSKLLPSIILLMIFFLVGLVSYWRFIYFTPDYIAPFVLAKQDIRLNGSLDVTSLPSAIVLDDKEKTLAFEVELTEGNFEQYNFAQFASPDTKLFIHAFNFQNISEKFFDAKLFESIKSGFNFKGNDLEVFFSNGFALIYPDNDFKTWGFVINAKDKAFADNRIAMLNKNRDSKGYLFKDYYATVASVENVSKSGVEGVVVEEDENAEASDDNKVTDEKEKDIDYFLLISNSKEFLDQMKESSEGNVNNLSIDIKFAQVKTELPKVGQAFIYHMPEAEIWDRFADWASEKYDYIGLDQILKAIDFPSVVLYSVDSKLKIRTADIM
ncbi:hypothetical protein CO178_02025 [candidate division WWE3 bacterium CG_4_9_14_3_um_filter_34_6]|uniref:Uncharacterized protein n=1 Tax=candidate division WWE3 bacterium CG_4_9_14_3_um_filter_34_6 TaxID=1975079 RepID=A0A2M7X308_UNCKA|nr:MAG: hypothetical protein CO178_02025 [candidate division WWE3 bacterium CG_4_9_14_3_um_filter_34_6]